MIYRFLIGLTIIVLERSRFRRARFSEVYGPLVKYPQYGRPYLLSCISGVVGSIVGLKVALNFDPEWLGVAVMIVAILGAIFGLGHFEKKAIEQAARMEKENWRPTEAAAIREVSTNSPESTGVDD